VNSRKKEIIYSALGAFIICAMWYLVFRLSDELFYLKSSLLYFLHQKSDFVITIASIVSAIAVYIDWKCHSFKYLSQLVFAILCYRLLFSLAKGFEPIDAAFLLIVLLLSEALDTRKYK
jgi:hypothetical protein